MATKSKKGEADGASNEDFDSRLARLEAIVQEMETGGLGLEGAISRYEEGVSLLKGCRTVLTGYRKQVEELTRGAEQALEAYQDDPDADGE
ncbi:MAG: exodeoxyribonuclease VII small subunit [Planctomycetota bacterium]|jgi:exodeoxyribonuclease VII small subunit